MARTLITWVWGPSASGKTTYVNRTFADTLASAPIKHKRFGGALSPLERLEKDVPYYVMLRASANGENTAFMMEFGLRDEDKDKRTLASLFTTVDGAPLLQRVVVCAYVPFDKAGVPLPLHATLHEVPCTRRADFVEPAPV